MKYPIDVPSVMDPVEASEQIQITNGKNIYISYVIPKSY